jgi:hypothetical protein
MADLVGYPVCKCPQDVVCLPMGRVIGIFLKLLLKLVLLKTSGFLLFSLPKLPK